MWRKQDKKAEQAHRQESQVMASEQEIIDFAWSNAVLSNPDITWEIVHNAWHGMHPDLECEIFPEDAEKPAVQAP